MWTCVASPRRVVLFGYAHVVYLIVLTSEASDWWSTLSRNHRSRSMANAATVEHCAALAAEDCGVLLSRSPLSRNWVAVLRNTSDCVVCVRVLFCA